MNNTIKKIVATITGLALAATMAPGLAQALTAEELQDQINALLAQLQTLQSQLATLQGTTPTVSGCTITSFDRNLKLGMTGDDVKCLQIVLNSDAATQLAASGVGSAGNETSYFGPLTQAAVVKFQEKYADEVLTSWGLTSGTGFVGSTTRAKLNSLLGVVVPPAGCTTAADCPTGYACTSGVCVMIPATAGLTVALAADTTPSGTVVAGQSIASLAKFVFTNGGSAELKITTLKVKRLGVSGDTTLSKVYLYDGVYRLGDEAVVSTGVISWNNAAGVIVIPAYSSKTIEVRSDILSTATGQTVGVGIIAATDITSDASAVNGTFPINGNIMSIATATLAGVSFTNSAGTTPSTNTSLEPQNDFVMFQNSVTIGTRAVYLHSLTFRNIGSVDKDTDLKNFRLYIDGIQVGEAVEKSDSDGYFTFDLSASPKKIETGTRVFKVVGDVIGGSTKTFQISLRKAADVNVTDSEYGANILIQVASATFTVVEAGVQTVSTGSLTITKRTDSPTGNVVKNGSSVILAKYDLKAYGENIKVESLKVSVTSSDPTDIGELRNGALFVDGTQVGSTMKLEETSGLGTDTDGLTYTEFLLGSSVIVVPGVPKVLEVRADIYDDDGTDDLAWGDTLKAIIVAGSSNCMRMVSGGYFDSPAETTASTLTVATGVLSASIDQSYGNQTVVVPWSNYLLGKFSVSAGPGEDINVHTIRVDFTFGNSDFTSTDLTNVYVKYGTKTTSLKSAITTAGATETSSNTWSVSEALTKLTSLTFEVYGDIASTAVVTADAEDKVTTELLVTGTTAQSGTTVYSGAAGGATVVTGQVVTADNAGVLTVTLDSGTPLAAQVVAGSTQDSGATKVKLAATKEDIYVKDLTFRVDTNTDDAAIQALTLYVAFGSGAYTQFGPAVTLNTDSTNPGFVRWILDGANRIKVAKNGSTYLLVKPTYVSSGQAAVTSLTPKIMLTDLQAEGVSVLTAGGTGANLVNSTGIVVKANGSATYVDSTENNTAANMTAIATTLVTGNTITFAPGDVIFIDENNDTTWDPATEELMVVLADGGANLTVSRGAYGTTAVAYTADTMNIYRLSGTVATYANACIIGNAMTVLNTKLTLAVAGDSPSGATTGSNDKIIFTFDAYAENNALDSAENKVVLTKVDLTTSKSAVTVNDVEIYPSEYDNNATYKTACSALSSTKWRCPMTTTGSVNEIIENTSRKYVVRADVGYSGAGNLQVGIMTLGTSDATTNDVTWTDGAIPTPTSITWVNQATSYIQGGGQTTTAASGTADTTVPYITAIAIADATENDDLEIDDTVTITFSEIIDPTTIKSTLVPGGSDVAITDGATGDLTAKDPSGAGNDYLEIKNIINLSVGNDTWVTADGASLTCAVDAALDATGKILTLTVTTALTGDGEAGATQTIVAGSGGTTVKDVNAVAMTAAGSDAATVTSDAI